jgi:hypothetical protein
MTPNPIIQRAARRALATSGKFIQTRNGYYTSDGALALHTHSSRRGLAAARRFIEQHCETYSAARFAARLTKQQARLDRMIAAAVAKRKYLTAARLADKAQELSESIAELAAGAQRVYRLLERGN